MSVRSSLTSDFIAFLIGPFKLSCKRRYLYLNLKILQADCLIGVKIDIKHHLGPLFGWPRPLNRGGRLKEGYRL
jgi:hypothetical protein